MLLSLPESGYGPSERFIFSHLYLANPSLDLSMFIEAGITLKR